MSHPSPGPSAPPAGHGWLIALTGLLGIVLTPVSVWCAMMTCDQFDPTCGTGGEGDIACVTRAFVVTLMSILPGLLVGVGGGVLLAARRSRKMEQGMAP